MLHLVRLYLLLCCYYRISCRLDWTVKLLRSYLALSYNVEEGSLSSDQMFASYKLRLNKNGLHPHPLCNLLHPLKLRNNSFLLLDRNYLVEVFYRYKLVIHWNRRVRGHVFHIVCTIRQVFWQIISNISRTNSLTINIEIIIIQTSLFFIIVSSIGSCKISRWSIFAIGESRGNYCWVWS